jgi:hypothetical protein
LQVARSACPSKTKFTVKDRRKILYLRFVKGRARPLVITTEAVNVELHIKLLFLERILKQTMPLKSNAGKHVS